MHTTQRTLSPESNSAGNLPGDSPLPMPKVRQYRPTQHIVLAGLLVVSVASIFTMRKMAGRAIAQDSSAQQVDYTHTIDPARSAQYDRIMSDLARLEKPMQLDVDLAAAAAFGEKKHSNTVQAGDNETDGQKQTRERKRRQNELLTKANSLVVQSVMGGRRPVARISGETFGVGDSVQDFKIVSIEGRNVTLEADGFRFTLAMETAQQQRMPGTGKTSSPKK
jgi:hypothetical protein